MKRWLILRVKLLVLKLNILNDAFESSATAGLLIFLLTFLI